MGLRDGTILAANCPVTVVGQAPVMCLLMYSDRSDVVLLALTRAGDPYTVRLHGQADAISGDWKRRSAASMVERLPKAVA